MGTYTAFPIGNRTFTDYTRIVNITDFGAVGDGITDNTAAINLAYASLRGLSGTVLWPPGTYVCNNTIVIGDSALTSGISTLCTGGAQQTLLAAAGAGVAVLISKNKFFDFQGLHVINFVAKGTTTGIVLGGPGGGTQTLTGVISNCIVENFDTGIQAGGSGGASSEILYLNVDMYGNNTGWTATDFNSLDHIFVCAGLAGNGIGIRSGAASGFSVFGGSASQSTITDFQIDGNAQQCYIGGGFRSEESLAVLKGTGGGQVVMEKTLMTSAQPPNFHAVTGTFKNLVVNDCHLDGFLAPDLGGGIQYIEATGNVLVRYDTARGIALTPPVPVDQGLFTQVNLRNNSDGNFPNPPITDLVGLMGFRYDGAVTVNLFYEPNRSVINIGNTGTPDLGVAYQSLNHVRSLSEGSMVGASAGTAPNPGKNLRVSGTFAASNTLAFTFKRTLTTTGVATPVVTATAGTFLPTDVGKPLKIALGADTGADWYGYITDYLTPTTVNVFPSAYATPGGRYPQGAGKTATVGEDEPDAKYIVAGLCGNANETFWVDTLATTGFTLHSSNAGSTATVTALIVR